MMPQIIILISPPRLLNIMVLFTVPRKTAKHLPGCEAKVDFALSDKRIETI